MTKREAAKHSGISLLIVVVGSFLGMLITAGMIISALADEWRS